MRLSSIVVGAAVLTAFCTSAARPVEAQTGIVVETVDLVTNTVTGTIAGLPFTTDITNFSLQPAPGNGRRCAILDLELDPITLDVLGLDVDTSPICLTITAFQGQGLLGDLLCGLAGGNPLDLTALGGLLTDILNVALNTSHGGGNGGGNGGSTVCPPGNCEVLDLVIGPLTLKLLGLQVHLDNCSNKAVEVCISADPNGGLLGSLLCSLSDLGILQNLSLQQLLGLIESLANLSPAELQNLTLQQLLDLIGGLLG